MSKNNFNRSFAIILGINNYENGIPELETAAPDALKLAQIIQEQHTHLKPQYQAQNKYEVQLLLNQRVTLKKLKQLIEDFKKGQILLDKEKVTVTKDDRVLFYFAGHGIALEALDNQDGPVGYLIPQDATLKDSTTYLPMQELHDALNALPCRHMLAILDCCFAGAFRWASLKRNIVPKVTVYKERYDRFICDAAWEVITSAADDQEALDSLGQRGKVIDGDEIHSPFAKALFDALRGGADEAADFNEDCIITATELYSYLRDKIEILTENQYKRQTPGFCLLKKHDKGEFIFLLPNFDRDKLANAPPLNLQNNPYRGLESYDEKDSGLFFGRENLIKQLYQHVVTQQQALTVVLGASGTGKSSFMKAGLLPRLRHSQEHQFQILQPMRPGENPLQALAQVCSPIATAITAEELAKDEYALATIIENRCKAYPKTQLLLPIDQFEELITLCKSDEEREQFQKLIKNAIARFSKHIDVVVTLRLDFEAQFQNSVLKDFWKNARFVVPPMSQDELREAIEKPASEKVVYFEPPSLVDELINEVVQMPGALPLLSFTLSELYLKYLGDRTRDNRALTKKDYEELGRVVGSLTKRANQEYDRLVKEDSAYKDTIRRVMLRMISLQGGELARRQVPKSELVYPDKDETERVNTVIQRFSEARLIVEGSNPQGEPYVEPAHDALVQGWDKMLKWKKDEEKDLILQRQLTPAAQEWKSVKSKEQPPGLQAKAVPVIDWLDRRLYVAENLFNNINTQFIRLWQRKQNQQERTREKPGQFLWNANPYLDVLNEKLNSTDNWFNQVEAEFVQQSVLQKRKNISWRWRIAIAVILGLSGLTLAALIGQRQALIGQIRASRQSAEANWRSNQELDALIDSLGAAKTLKDWPWFLLKPDKELKNQVSQTLRRLYYITKERNRNTKPEGILVGMTPDNKVLVSEPPKTLVNHLLDSEGNQVVPFSGFQASFNPVNYSPGITYSPNRKLLAVADIYGASWNADTNGTVSLWNIENKKLIRFPGHQGGVKSISFSPDGTKMATADASDTVRLWNLKNIQEFKEFKDNTYKNIVGIGFSPDNQLLVATGDNDENKLRLWEIEGKQKWSELNGDGDKRKSFSRAIFSNDGKRIMIEYGLVPEYQTDGTRDISIFLWNYLEDKQKNDILLLSNLYSFPLESSDISISMNLDGKQLATALSDSNIRFWSLEDKKLEWEEFPHEAISLSLSADGKKLATTDKNGKVGIWNLDSRQFVSIPEIPGLVKKLSLSADGKKLAIINQDGTVGLWNFESRKFVSLNKKFSGGALESKDVKSMGIKFSLDSQQLAIISHSSENPPTVVKLWNLKTDKMQIITDLEGHIDIIFSPNNQLQKLITSALDEETILSDLKDILLLKFQQTRCSFSSFYSPLYTDFLPVSVSEDGSLIASASSSYDSVCIWDLKNGKELARFKVPQGQIKSISMSGDSSLIAVAVDNGSILLWQIGSFNKLIELGCDSVREYLNNPNVDESDRHLCDDIPPTAANPGK